MMRARFKQIATALEIRPALVGTLSTLLLLIIWSIWASEAKGMHSSFVGPLELLRRLKMPVITTLHTVLREPNPDQLRRARNGRPTSRQIRG